MRHPLQKSPVSNIFETNLFYHTSDMDSPFIFDRFVTGKNFIGRKDDCTILRNLLSQGENVAIYEPPKSGKTSLIQQTFFNMRLTGGQFSIAQLSLLDVRDSATFLTRLGSAVLKATLSTPEEYAAAVPRLLSGTHFVFDRKRFNEAGEALSLNWDPDGNDIETGLRLGWKLSRESGRQLIVVLTEFQNISRLDDSYEVLKIFEKVLAEERSAGDARCSFLFCGSMVNAMKWIFEEKRYFFRNVERLKMHPVETREIVEYVVRGFLSSGKVIERELLTGACNLLKNNLWYINHLVSICDSRSKGYIVESVLEEALGALVAIHEPQFIATISSLTTFQLHLLKAILDGVTRFSASDVISRYGLSSSANVKRLKDALMKKEIVTFNGQDEPELLDPLFEYWVRNMMVLSFKNF